MTSGPHVRPMLRMGWVSWLGCAVIVFGGGPAAAAALFVSYAFGGRSNYAGFRLACGIVGVVSLALAGAALLFVVGAVLMGGS